MGSQGGATTIYIWHQMTIPLLGEAPIRFRNLPCRPAVSEQHPACHRQNNRPDSRRKWIPPKRPNALPIHARNPLKRVAVLIVADRFSVPGITGIPAVRHIQVNAPHLCVALIENPDLLPAKDHCSGVIGQSDGFFVRGKEAAA